MRAVDAIVERKVAAGRAAGLFDNLPGVGKPLPDIDQQRRPGWWGERVEKRERHQMRRDELAASVRRAIPALQRTRNEAGLASINAQIAEYNRVTTVKGLRAVEFDVVWSPDA